MEKRSKIHSFWGLLGVGTHPYGYSHQRGTGKKYSKEGYPVSAGSIKRVYDYLVLLAQGTHMSGYPNPKFHKNIAFFERFSL